MTDLPLAADFPSATDADWRKLVDIALKGAPFDKTLVSQTYDGLRIDPLYPRRPDAVVIAGRGAKPWEIVQRVDHPDPATANAQVLDDLANGASGLTLIGAGCAGDHGFSVAMTDAALARMLDGVFLDAGISVDLELGPADVDAPRHLAALVAERGIAPSSTRIRFGIDPLGAMAADGGGALRWSDAGGGPLQWDEIAPHLAAEIRELAAQGYRGPFAVADGRRVHAAGGSEAQELAFALGNAVAILRALDAASIALPKAAPMIYFRLAADADQFLTIAKFRALRRLWARVQSASGVAPEPAFVCAHTAWRMMTRRDPYTNMLRATVAVFAAAAGGADAIVVLPFTAAIGLPDAAARRIARNAQLVLREESNLAKVADPAAGSGGLEALTDQLCHEAWRLFQDIERAGGAAAATEAGLLQGRIAATRAARQTAATQRQDMMVGTSDFPQVQEHPVAVLDRAPAASAPAATPAIEPLPSIRLAEPFEQLRDASDRMLATGGARPTIFLATLGAVSDFSARAGFARNFFEAGGIETVEFAPNAADAGTAALAAAFKASGAKLACLCASDAVYGAAGADAAKDAAKALAEAGARHIYLAGRPRDLEAVLRDAGVKTFVFAGCDAVATLRGAYDSLEANNRQR